MRDKTYRFAFFTLYQWEEMARYLEEMAAKGWLLDKAGNTLWRFRRVPPQKLRFEVVFFPDASGFDPGPTEGLRVMEDYSARDGWRLLAQWGQAQFFVNDREDPVPMETDPVVQVETLRKAMRRTMLPAHFLLLGVILFQLWTQLSQLWKDPVDFFSSSFYLGMIPFWLLLLAAQGCEIGSYFRWVRRARQAAEDGVFLSAGGRRWIWLLLGLAVLILVWTTLGSALWTQSLAIWSGCYLLILLLTTLARDAMKRRGVSRRVNRALSIGFCVLLTFGLLSAVTAILLQRGVGRPEAPESYRYRNHTFSIWHDPIPLKVEDLAPAEGVRYSTQAKVDRTFLLSKREYSQDALLGESPEAPELEYTIVEVKAGALYGLCRDSMLEEDPLFERDWRPADAAPWGANAAYRMYRHGEPDDWYLLCFPDRLAEVCLRNLDLAPEGMALAGETLKTM